MEEFYCLVAGSRTFNDKKSLYATLDFLLQNYKEIHIVAGEAKGADELAKQYAFDRNYLYHGFPADWNTFGKSAGYKRNIQMHKFIAQFQKRGCVCFWDGQSKGTAHNFELAKKLNTPLRIIRF